MAFIIFTVFSHLDRSNETFTQEEIENYLFRNLFADEFKIRNSPRIYPKNYRFILKPDHI